MRMDGVSTNIPPAGANGWCVNLPTGWGRSLNDAPACHRATLYRVVCVPRVRVRETTLLNPLKSRTHTHAYIYFTRYRWFGGKRELQHGKMARWWRCVIIRVPSNKSERCGTMLAFPLSPCRIFALSFNDRYIRRCTGERSISEDTI